MIMHAAVDVDLSRREPSVQGSEELLPRGSVYVYGHAVNTYEFMRIHHSPLGCLVV